jgi:hypothetical protein
MLRAIRVPTIESFSRIGRSEGSNSFRIDNRRIDLAGLGGPSGRDPDVDERCSDSDTVAGVDLDRGAPAFLNDHLAIGRATTSRNGGTQE